MYDIFCKNLPKALRSLAASLHCAEGVLWFLGRHPHQQAAGEAIHEVTNIAESSYSRGPYCLGF